MRNAYAVRLERPTRPLKLIKLGKPQLIRIVDDDRIYIGNIQSGLDDRGGH